MLTRTMKQHAIGMVLGAAVGDALGAPFEFRAGGLYRKHFPQPVLGGAGEMVGGGGFGWAPGEFTDDTQMAVALAEAFLAAGGHDPDVVWQWFRAWARTARDVGITTRASLAHTDWRTVPADGRRSAGNGALMRSFVLAAALLDEPDSAMVRDVVLAHAALTHPDPAAGWGAWIAVEMCRTAIRGGDPLAVLDGLVAALPGTVRSGFAPLLGTRWHPDQAHPSNGSVWGCLAEAVWALRATSSFEEAVVAAINRGGDTDTVACVTGALAGARYGVQRIPSRWTTYVHGHVDTLTGPRRYTAAELQRLAVQLLGLADKPETEPESPAGPLEVAPGLHAADLGGAATVPTDWAVVSLCRTGATFADHGVRRQVFLVDQPGDHNHALADAVDDAVRSIDAFLAEGRPVVVHCHGGRSRTGLVLKAWKMRADGVSEREAHDWLAARWHRYHDRNATFVEMLRTEWTA
jgi:ADP-ribosyl-[dinitrogen reductase] hydrolase